MSSEISTDAAFQPKHFFAIVTMLAATAAVLVAPVTSFASLILVSLAVMSTGLVAAAAYRTVAALAIPDDHARMSTAAGRARLALEREKALVLRSIKELEFDRAMGKVAEGDFNEMSSRLRARAIGLMKQLDREQPNWDAVIDAEVARRRGVTRLAPEQPPVAKPSFAACASCGTANDADARFCKNCGGRLSSAEATSTSS